MMDVNKILGNKSSDRLNKILGKKTVRKQTDAERYKKIRENIQGKRCNKGHLLKEEYEDSNGKIWRWDCPICIEDMNKIRRGESSEFE